MKKTRMTALLLLLSLSAAACGEAASSPAQDTTASQTDAAYAETEAAETEPQYEADSLPETDMGGRTVNVYGWSGPSVVEFYVDEANGEIVNDAIYERNTKVEERLNIKLSYTMEPGAYDNRGSWVKKIKSSILAGDSAYDIYGGYSMAGATMAYERLGVDLMELDYPDFDKPWWPDSLIKEATCGGKLYFCSGDISTYMIYYMYATFFNKDLAESYGIESPYQMVRNGSWTLDKMIEICSGVYNDLNGDGKKGIDDQFGFTTQRIFTDNFFFASGLRTTIPGDEGLPVLSPEFGGEKTQALVEKLVSAFDMEGLYNHDDSGTAHIPFAEGRAVFLMHEVQTAEIRLRTSDINYGIIPSPKYDEAQSDYYGVTSFPYTLYGIPIDAPDPQQSGIVLEALASESYRTVSPALFETALKVKYASDEDMSEMYDIIRRNNVFDIGRIFNDSMNGATYSLFRTAVADGKTTWISTYEKSLKSLQKNFDKVIGALTAEG